VAFKSYKQLNSNKRLYDVYPNHSEELHPKYNTIWQTMKWRESSLPLEYHRTEMKKTRYKLIKDYFSVDGALYKDTIVVCEEESIQKKGNVKVTDLSGKPFWIPIQNMSKCQ